jgi:hypothetical protein
VSEFKVAEPPRPVPVEVSRDAELVRRGVGIHDGPATRSRAVAGPSDRRRAGRRIDHSATARLNTRPAEGEKMSLVELSATETAMFFNAKGRAMNQAHRSESGS